MKLEQLHVWVDPTPRVGVENMAVDELLLQSVADTPVIRFYQWSDAEVSFGYFDELAQAQSKFTEADLGYVRRWTGGGIVDHRVDTTYTLVIPREHAWAKLRGAESYGLIHKAVVEALHSCGVEAELITQDSGSGSVACFENPVAFDVVNGKGEKLAGAGQRRTRWGLLHQGSVQGVEFGEQWIQALTVALTDQVKQVDPEICDDEVRELAKVKYATDAWLKRR